MFDLFDTRDDSWMNDASKLCRNLARPVIVPSMTAQDYDKSDGKSRNNYDQQRFEYMSQTVVATDSIHDLRNRLLRTMLINRNAVAGRAGLLISGPAGLGKTTAVRALASWTVRRYQRQLPDATRNGDVPAVYVSVPPPATPKSMIARLATSIHIPVRARDSAESLRREVAPQLRALHTQLLIVDEIHRLARDSNENAETTNVLKDLSDLVPCTFVFAGVAVEQSGLLAGERGAQIAGRFSLARMVPYSANRLDDWTDVVAGFVQRSCLFGPIEVDPEYLLERTQGSIGMLHAMFVQVIGLKLSEPHESNDERVTQEDFEQAMLPMQAEEEPATALVAGQLARKRPK
ncbi:TniB family NTP-binding protein [Curtobacterium sp. MCPF17_051]|uniref:TniB family NTP-binding protein n=1 Tax=Curtobacterium sp. MCPF17_051 TaxID=2175640 RepID=UPI000DA7EF01|nr:TniB family NTP-binding protein [Curtobacterium sp. MCPF17_051]PZF32066.1 hypothetical protein DEJ35_05445 [Curtobacterium sp. MCPF17_051]